MKDLKLFLQEAANRKELLIEKSKYSFSHRKTIINITSENEFPFDGEITVDEAE